MKKNRIALFILLLLAIIAAYFVFTNKVSTIREELRDFAVEDTAAVDKIFMADKTGARILLEKKSPVEWTVNGKGPVRQDAINLLLYTMKKMEVRSPVGKAARENIIRDMAAKSVKVEVYQKKKLIKTFYVGGATQDQLGTYMYLEKSSVPFIMHIPGFDGYLTPRFILNEVDWRIKSIFAFKRGEIASLVVQNTYHPEHSFELRKITDDGYSLLNFPGGQVQNYTDSGKIQGYLASYQFINYEKLLLTMPKNQIDSVLAVGPMMIIEAEHVNGTKTRLDLYLKPADENLPGNRDENGKLLPADPDRMIARLNFDTNLVVVQYFSFDKLMVTLDHLKNPETKSNR